MNTDKYLILSLAKAQIEKELKKANERVARLSNKLFNTSLTETSMRNRSMQRVRISCAAEERDRWDNRLRLVNEWINQIKSEG